MNKPEAAVKVKGARNVLNTAVAFRVMAELAIEHLDAQATDLD